MMKNHERNNLALQKANLLRHKPKSDGVENLALSMSTLMFNIPSRIYDKRWWTFFMNLKPVKK